MQCIFCICFVLSLPVPCSVSTLAKLTLECWTQNETFDFCCDKERGPLGNDACFIDGQSARNYVRCCGVDKAWSARYRILRVLPRVSPPEFRWLPRFDLNRVAENVEFFLMRLLLAEKIRDSHQASLLHLHKACDAGVYIISNLLRVQNRRAKRGLGVFSSTTMETSWIPDYADGACFIVLHSTDDDYVADLRQIRARGGRFISFAFINAIITKKFDTMRYLWTNRHALTATHAVQNYSIHHGTHFVSQWRRYEGICQMLESTKDVDGDYVEVGVYQGMSARLALEYLSRRQPSHVTQRPWHVYLLDRFSGFSMAEDTWYVLTTKQGGMQHLGDPTLNIAWINEVLEPWSGNYSVHEVDIVRDPLPSSLLARGVAAANLDVDSYEATLASLQKVGPHVKLGGIMRLDDTVTTPSLIGSTLAMDDYLKEVASTGLKFVKFMSDAHYLIRVQ